LAIPLYSAIAALIPKFGTYDIRRKFGVPVLTPCARH
jgi:hypothetical protein